MDYIVFILFDISGVKFWPGLDSGELKGGQWVGVGGKFLHMGRPIGNLFKPIWGFLNSQYYDL